MNKNIIYQVAGVICAILVLMVPVSGISMEKASLMELIEDNEDIHMDANEMAFFLITHGYDAIPKGDHVIVNIDGEALKIVP